MSKFHFRCKSNPNAPVLTLTTKWEAAEMAEHPDYERIDEFGEPILDEYDTPAEKSPLSAPTAA